MYADWTDRIAAGEVPEAPPRPQGVERNVVVSLWDWSNDRGFVHDTISTDKRNPTLNANGPVYSISRFSQPDVNILDPVRHTATGVEVPIRDTNTEYTNPQKNLEPSPYWGEDIIWSGQASLHNPMLDAHRTGLAHACDSWDRQSGLVQSRDRAIHPPSSSLSTPAAAISPCSIRKPSRSTMIDTCFGTHHLQFAEDANQHAVFQWERPGAGLVQHEAVRRDEG